MKRLTESQKDAIIRLRKAGKGYKTIAEKLSLSRETVRGFCMRYKELINAVSVNDDKSEAGFTKAISNADKRRDVEYSVDISRGEEYIADKSRDVEYSVDISHGEGYIADLSADKNCGVNAIGDICKNCGKPVEQTAGIKHRIFCSKKCRQEWWNSHPEAVKQKAIYVFTCPNCGNAFTVYGNKNRKYCSHSCYITDRFGKERTL